MKTVPNHLIGWFVICVIVLGLTVKIIFGNQLVEIPLRIQNVFSKRVVDPSGFYIAMFDPQGHRCLIPEEEIARFRQLALEVDIDWQQFPFIPWQAAVGEYAKATVSVEFTGELRFWLDDRSAWITWDEDHPAPIATVDGVEIAWQPNPGFPRQPEPLRIQP